MKKESLIRNIVLVFGLTVSVSVIVLAVLQLFRVWDGAVNVLVPLLGLNQLCLAYGQWKSNRKIAWFCICTAAFIFVCSVVVFFVK